MCKYKRGDVVWVLCVFTNGTGVKPRPCIISNVKSLIQSCEYFIIECSTIKDKHSGMKGKVIGITHPEYSNLGFEEATFITQTKGWVKEHFMKPPPNRGTNPIGFCNFIDALEIELSK